jgi:hypothetical protein
MFALAERERREQSNIKKMQLETEDIHRTE